MIKGEHGIAAIVKAAQSFQIVVTEESLRHKLGIACQQLTVLDVCQAARQAGLRAKSYQEITGNLQTLPLPILVCLSGKWSVIEKIASEYWWRYDLAANQLYQEPLPVAVNGKYDIPIVLLAEQEIQITDIKFGFNWFLPAILRHIKQSRDVLALSLMMQLLALVSPKLFQQVIDQVLV